MPTSHLLDTQPNNNIIDLMAINELKMRSWDSQLD